MRKDKGGLYPANEMSAEELAKVSKDQVLVTIRTPRNPKQFALAWALAQKVHEACGWLHDKDDAMDYLKVRARHVKYITEPRGRVTIVPKSISWASLSQDAFKRVLDRMIWVTVNEILPGVDEGALRNEIESMVG